MFPDDSNRTESWGKCGTEAGWCNADFVSFMRTYCYTIYNNIHIYITLSCIMMMMRALTVTVRASSSTEDTYLECNVNTRLFAFVLSPPTPCNPIFCLNEHPWTGFKHTYQYSLTHLLSNYTLIHSMTMNTSNNQFSNHFILTGNWHSIRTNQCDPCDRH